MRYSLTSSLTRLHSVNRVAPLDPMSRIWTDRPALPQKPIRKHPMEWAGTTAADKLTAIRRRLAAVHADGMLVSALDDIAWTLNLRGADIECNPVFIAYLLIASRGATLFTECSRVSDEVKEYLNDNGVELRPYNKIGEGLAQYFEYSILMDGNETAALMPRYVRSRINWYSVPSSCSSACRK